MTFGVEVPLRSPKRPVNGTVLFSHLTFFVESESQSEKESSSSQSEKGYENNQPVLENMSYLSN